MARCLPAALLPARTLYLQTLVRASEAAVAAPPPHAAGSPTAQERRSHDAVVLDSAAAPDALAMALSHLGAAAEVHPVTARPEAAARNGRLLRRSMRDDFTVMIVQNRREPGADPTPTL